MEPKLSWSGVRTYAESEGFVSRKHVRMVEALHPGMLYIYL
jgi:hypothetical protein